MAVNPSSLATVPQDIPAELSASIMVSEVFEALGKGVQIYSCKQKSGTDSTQGEWSVKPFAVLYDIKGSGHIVAWHYADPITGNPTWEAKDGSKVIGKKVAGVPASQVNGTANDIDWLLLRAVSTEGSGCLGQVIAIQRVDTKGGVGPKDSCNPSTDHEVGVEYSAHYLFYGPPDAFKDCPGLAS